MSNVAYQLTLTSEQANSGPYYAVTYTTGAYFVPVLAGSPAFLPNVGSTALVQIPQAAASASYLAFNLNNEGEQGPCALCDNDVSIVITGSVPTFICCTGSILTTQQSGSVLQITYNSSITGSGCYDCAYITVQSSSNGINWGGDITGSCGISQSINLPLPPVSCSSYTTYYRIYQTCTGSITPTTTTTTTSTTTTTTTGVPTTSTTTTTTTGVPTTSTTTTTTTSPTTTTTSTTTTTTTTPPTSSCIELEYTSEQVEYLDCGVFDLYRAYTASFFTNCTASNAPEDIFVYFTASGGSPVTTSIYTLIINSGSHQGFEDVYTRLWAGDCLNKVSTDYTVDGYNIVPSYVTCSCPTTTTTTTSTTTTTTTAATTTTSTTTTTTTIPPDCSCYTLENTDSVDISIQFYDCQSGQVCNICPAGSTIYLCIPDNQSNNYTVHLGTGCTGGTPSYVFTPLGTNCTGSGQCI